LKDGRDRLAADHRIGQGGASQDIGLGARAFRRSAGRCRRELSAQDENLHPGAGLTDLQGNLGSLGKDLRGRDLEHAEVGFHQHAPGLVPPDHASLKKVAKAQAVEAGRRVGAMTR
jgi:hypothetical protein